jgi:6-phosphogluconolactonase
MKHRIFFLIISIISIMTPFSLRSQSPQDFLYVGTYTENGAAGIYVYQFDRNTGAVNLVETAGDLASPSYLTIHPNGRYLYSVNRGKVLQDKNWGSVSAFSIESGTGHLNHLNDQPVFGSEACYISTDSQGRLAFVANYSTGNVVVFPIKNNGTLGTISDARQHSGGSINLSRQKGPHAHCAYVSPDDKHLYVVDLGIDRIKTYEIDYLNIKLIPRPESDGLTEPGSGPRHITFDQEGKFAYVIEELASSIRVFQRDPGTGALKPIQDIRTIPEDFTDTNYPADIHIDPTGKYLYGSNRGHDSLAIFRINEKNGTLEKAGYQSVSGKWPRNFLIDPKGEYVFVVNQNSDNLAIFKLDPSTGNLEKISDNTSISKPVCVKILTR